MNRKLSFTIAAAAPLLGGACAPQNSDYEEALRTALAEADVSLVEAIAVAEAQTFVGYPASPPAIRAWTLICS